MPYRIWQWHIQKLYSHYVSTVASVAIGCFALHLLLLICSYQYGPDTYLLQVKDATFPARLREYLNVARTTSADFQDCKVRGQRGGAQRKEASYFNVESNTSLAGNEPLRKLILKWQAVV